MSLKPGASLKDFSTLIHQEVGDHRPHSLQLLTVIYCFQALSLTTSQHQLPPPDKMDEPLTTLMTTVADYYDTETGTTADTDYDMETTGMCDRGWVRGFRGRYEPPLFGIIFVLGALGNLMVVWIYSTVRNRLKTMTDVYLLNLAVADLLFLCMLPFWAVDAAKGWEFGVGLCKVVSSVYKINLFSSMLLLTCISVDRYIAIVQVTKAQNLKKKRLFYSKLTCLAVWLVSALLALPEFIFSQVKKDPNSEMSFCHQIYWNNALNRTKILVLSLQICMGFCLPLLVMVFCYSVIIRTLLQAKSFEKHKALRVIFVVVLVFILSQLPYNSVLIVEATQAANTTDDCKMQISVDVAGQVAKSLAYTHACLNPFLYVFVGVRFRQDLLRMVKMCAGGLRSGGWSKGNAVPKRPSVMSDTDTTPALSL